jgi:hypothetical protein
LENPDQRQADRVFMLSVALVLALALAVYSYKAAAQGWVDQLQNAKGSVCCSNNDGRRLDDPDWDTLGKVDADYNGLSGYRVWEDGEWKGVPNWAVVHMRNQDGIARVWFERSYEPGGTTAKRVKCFLPGSLG